MPSPSRVTDYRSLLDLDAQVEQNKQAQAAKQAAMSRDFTLEDWLTSPDPYAAKLKGLDIDLGDRYGPDTFSGKVVGGVEAGLQSAKDYLSDAMSGQGALDYRDQQIKDKQRIAAMPSDQRGPATAESAINTAMDWGGAGIMAGNLAKGANRAAKTGWQKTSKEYDMVPEKKGVESIYLPVGRSKVEVVQNPSNADISSMSKEAEKQYGRSDVGDPVLRYTDDAEGNRYYWKASEAVHQSIEPALGARVGAELSQNMGQKPTHRSVVRRALYDGESVPEGVVGEYPGLLDEVRDIPGNKAPGTPSESLMHI